MNATKPAEIRHHLKNDTALLLAENISQRRKYSGDGRTIRGSSECMRKTDPLNQLICNQGVGKGAHFTLHLSTTKGAPHSHSMKNQRKTHQHSITDQVQAEHRYEKHGENSQDFFFQKFDTVL